MSRIGRTPITIPPGVNVNINSDSIVVKGSKGELTQSYPAEHIKITQETDTVLISRLNDDRQTKAYHGLFRSLIANMIIGVTEGYQKRLELVGTGYRVKKEGQKLILSLGFSHPVEIEPQPGINFEIEGNNQIIVSGIDKQQVGQIAASIRSKRPPEPYKGKGIRYQGELVRRKAGKAAAAAA